MTQQTTTGYPNTASVLAIVGGVLMVLGFPVIYHMIWGIISFAVLTVATVLGFRDYGTKSNLFRVSVSAIVIFVIQGILGLISFGSNVAIVVHLGNAFVLGILVTYMISFADGLAKKPTQPQA